MRYALIAAREAMDLTQQQLGDKLDLDRSSIAKYELGQSDIPGKVLHRLSQILCLPMDVLYRNSETPFGALSRKKLLAPQAIARAERAAGQLHQQLNDLLVMQRHDDQMDEKKPSHA